MRNCRSAKGFTLIELLITLALLGILAFMAIPSVQLMIANQAVSNVSSDLMTDLLQARSIAMSRNKPVVVSSVDSDWTKGWTIYIDGDRDGTFTSGTDTLVITHAAVDANLSIDSGTVTQFVYEPSGFLSLVSNASLAITSTQTSRRRTVIVSKPGRPRICDPAAQSCAGS